MLEKFKDALLHIFILTMDEMPPFDAVFLLVILFFKPAVLLLGSLSSLSSTLFSASAGG